MIIARLEKSVIEFMDRFPDTMKIIFYVMFLFELEVNQVLHTLAGTFGF